MNCPACGPAPTSTKRVASRPDRWARATTSATRRAPPRTRSLRRPTTAERTARATRRCCRSRSPGHQQRLHGRPGDPDPPALRQDAPQMARPINSGCGEQIQSHQAGTGDREPEQWRQGNGAQGEPVGHQGQHEDQRQIDESHRRADIARPEPRPASPTTSGYGLARRNLGWRAQSKNLPENGG